MRVLLPSMKRNEPVRNGEFKEKAVADTNKDSTNDKAILDKVNGNKKSWLKRLFR